MRKVAIAVTGALLLGAAFWAGHLSATRYSSVSGGPNRLMVADHWTGAVKVCHQRTLYSAECTPWTHKTPWQAWRDRRALAAELASLPPPVDLSGLPDR